MDINEDVDYKRTSLTLEDQWTLGGTISVAAFSEASEGRERPKQSLQIIPKIEENSNRPCLKATMWEILCYFRVYTTTICKKQIVTLGEDDINQFFWYRVLNLLCSSMPHVFVQVFIAAYVPDAQFYLSKMNPLTCGYNFTVIMAAVIELVLFTNSNTLLMDFFWQGLLKKSPWKKCNSATMPFQANNKEYAAECCTLDQFVHKIKRNEAENKTLYFFKQAYYYENGTDREYFQLSHLVYYWDRLALKYSFRSGNGSIYNLYLLFICVTAVLHFNQLYKKYMWKVMKFSHYAEVVMILIMYIYIQLIDETLDEVPENSIIRIKNVSKRNLIDIDFLAIMMNAPPVAQILISRSTKDHSKIEYESLSSLLVFSNWIYSYLAAATTNSIKKYCEAIVGVHLYLSDLNAAFFFYLTPIFFSRFFIGNILCAFFILAKLITDTYAFMITYLCLIESIMCEWKIVSRFFVHTGVILAGTLVYVFLDFDNQLMLYMYSRIVVIFVEVLGIYCLYPIGRLIEDMTFHRGSPPNSFRIWSLRLVSMYVFIKLYTILNHTSRLFTSEEGKLYWIIPTAPLILGIIYKVLTHKFVQKKAWNLLIVPVNNWGPAEPTTRYCRKIYKSDEYIGSQADRVLSRYMLSKTESEVVHLDIRYDTHRRSTFMRYEDEKKNL